MEEIHVKQEMKIKKTTASMLSLYFRWVLVILLIMLSFLLYSDVKYSRMLPLTMLVIIVYNFIITLYVLKRTPPKKTPIVGFLFSDVILLSLYSFLFGGITNEVYIFYYFIIAYCATNSNFADNFKITILSIILYTLACIFQPPILSTGDFLTRLAVRDILMILGAFGISQISREVKKYDEIYKLESKMARTDKLTGLANRHYFEQRLIEEVAYSDATENPLNVLLFDLDDFKKFNDTYGHTWGDKLLTLFSDIIRQNVRKSDLPVRYGGEEFLILLRDMDIVIARSVSERICRQLEKQRIYLSNEDIKQRVTASCGIAQYPKNSNDIKQVIDMADKAMYKAKALGKNTVVTYDELLLALKSDGQ